MHHCIYLTTRYTLLVVNISALTLQYEVHFTIVKFHHVQVVLPVFCRIGPYKTAFCKNQGRRNT
jgi:hypothetical protein